jgi:hypothetical protein
LNVIRENKAAANIWQYFNYDFPFQKIQTQDKYVFFYINTEDMTNTDIIPLCANKEATEPRVPLG